MQHPQCVEDVQRFAGFINYLSRFLPRLSDVMEPLRKLTHKDCVWKWESEEEDAFIEAKKLVSAAPVLAYFDDKKELVMQCDSSSKGLGVVMLQDGQPIAFASRALTAAEKNYAQIEKEMLSIVFGLEKFHQYTFGRKVIVQNDHKPLESILKKSLHIAPKRLQNMILRTQKYDIAVLHKPGVEMLLPDMLSRAYLNTTEPLLSQDELESVNMVKYLPITTDRLNSIKIETKSDATLQTLKSVILQGWPEENRNVPTEVHAYIPHRDELTVQDGLIFKQDRVVIPLNLRSEIKKKVHSSHLGIEGCLRRARECIFWPGMNSDIKDYVQKCDTCRKYDVAQQKETLMPHEIPDRAWARIGVDLFTLDAKEYMVTVDYLSNFFEVDALQTTTSSVIIRKLKRHFARYGIPDTLVSDNGPQFTATEFKDFAKSWSFEHVSSSPYNSKGNGKAESAVKTAKRLMKKARDTNSDPLMAFLDYRNTPLQGIGLSPVQLLMHKRTKTMLPTKLSLLKSVHDSAKPYKFEDKQRKQAFYYNRGAKDLPPLDEGDRVRLKPTSVGAWREGTVLKRLDERSYTIDKSNGIIRRNRQQLRKILPSTKQANDDTHSIVPSDTEVPERETADENPEVKTPVVETPKKKMPDVINSPRKNTHSYKQEVEIQETSHSSPVVTKSGRRVILPARFQ